MAESLGEAVLDLRADNRGFDSDIDRSKAKTKELEGGFKSTETTLKELGGSLTGIGKSLRNYVTLPILAAGAAMLKMASDAGESANKFDVVMGEAADDVRERLQALTDIVPLTTGEMEAMAAGIQDMLVPMGLARDQAGGMSADMVALAADLGSFNNVGTAEVLEAMKSALAGASEPMRRFGVDTRVTRLQQLALSEGLIEQGEALDNTSTALAVMRAIQIDSRDAMGDSARTADEFANSTRLLWRDIRQLAETMGRQLIPAIEPLIAKGREWVGWLLDLSVGQQRTILLVGGFAAALGPLLIVVGGVLTAIGGLAGSLAAGGALATGLGVVGGAVTSVVGVLTGPVGGIALLAALAVKTGVVKDATEEFGPVLESTWHSYRNFMAGIEASFHETWDPLIAKFVEARSEFYRWTLSFGLEATKWVTGYKLIEGSVKDVWAEVKRWSIEQQNANARAQAGGNVLKYTATEADGLSGWMADLAGNTSQFGEDIKAAGDAARQAEIDRQAAAAAAAAGQLKEALSGFTTETDAREELATLSLVMGKVPSAQLESALGKLIVKMRDAGLAGTDTYDAAVKMAGSMWMAVPATEAEKNMMAQAEAGARQLAKEYDDIARAAKEAAEKENALTASMANMGTDGYFPWAGIARQTAIETEKWIKQQEELNRRLREGEHDGRSFFTKAVEWVSKALGAVTDFAVKLGTKLDKALGGIFSKLGLNMGNMFGEAIGSGLLALAGPLVGKVADFFSGLLKGIFKKTTAGDIIAQFGMELSDGLEQTIQAVGDQHGRDYGAAFRLSLGKVIAEVGVKTRAAFSQFVKDTLTTLADLDRGTVTSTEAVKAMGESILALIPSMRDVGASAMDFKAVFSDMISRANAGMLDMDSVIATIQASMTAMTEAGVEGVTELDAWLKTMGVDVEHLAQVTSAGTSTFREWAAANNIAINDVAKNFEEGFGSVAKQTFFEIMVAAGYSAEEARKAWSQMSSMSITDLHHLATLTRDDFFSIAYEAGLSAKQAQKAWDDFSRNRSDDGDRLTVKSRGDWVQMAAAAGISAEEARKQWQHMTDNQRIRLTDLVHMNKDVWLDIAADIGVSSEDATEMWDWANMSQREIARETKRQLHQEEVQARKDARAEWLGYKTEWRDHQRLLADIAIQQAGRAAGGWIEAAGDVLNAWDFSSTLDLPGPVFSGGSSSGGFQTSPGQFRFVPGPPDQPVLAMVHGGEVVGRLPEAPQASALPTMPSGGGGSSSGRSEALLQRMVDELASLKSEVRRAGALR